MGLKQAYFVLRDQIRFAWAQKKYSYEPQGQIASFNWANMNNIVILKLDGKLGDTQVMTHFYRNLKNLPHKPNLIAVCPENLASVYDEVLGFDQVLISSRKPKIKEIENLCNQIIALAKSTNNSGKIDLLLSTEPNYRPRDFIFNYFLKPDYIVGCDPKVKDINIFLYHPNSYNHPVSEAFCHLMDKGHLNYSKEVSYTPLFNQESLQKALSYLRANATKQSYVLQEQFLNNTNRLDAFRFKERANIGDILGVNQSQIKLSSKRFDDQDFIFGINPLGAPKARRMNIDTTVSLCTECLKSAVNTKVLLMCHRSFDEYINEVTKAIDKEILYDTNGKERLILMPQNSSVLDLGALVYCLDALITVDTATVHMACANSVPQLCFYNNDSAESCRWAPIGHLHQCIKFADADFMTMPKESFLLVAKGFIKEQVELNLLSS